MYLYSSNVTSVLWLINSDTKFDPGPMVECLNVEKPAQITYSLFGLE